MSEFDLRGKKYFNEKEAAHYCGVSLHHFARQRIKHGIPAARFMGKKLYRKIDLDEIISPLFPSTSKTS